MDPQGFLAAVERLEKLYVDQLAKERQGTKHGFHNGGASPVEIMEVFIR